MLKRISDYTTVLLVTIIAGFSLPGWSGQYDKIHANVTLTGDNQILEAYFNGNALTLPNRNAWTVADQILLVPLNPEKNVLAFRVKDVGGPASFIANFKMGEFEFGSSGNWRVSKTAPPANWSNVSFSDDHWDFATSHGFYGSGPWEDRVDHFNLDSPAQWLWSENKNAPNETDNEVWLRFTFTGNSSISETNRVSFPMFNEYYHYNGLTYDSGVSCPPGKVMTKLAVAHDWVVNGLSFYCSTLSTGGSLSNETRQNNFTRSNYPLWIGSSRGNIDVLQCAPGTFITGFNARIGSYLDQIGLQCSSWDSALNPSVGPIDSESAGGDGGSVVQESCPAGYAVSSARVHVSNPANPTYVSHFAFDCRSLVDPMGEFSVSQSDQESFITAGDSSQDGLTDVDFEFSCPANMVVTDLEYKHDNRSINSDGVEAIAFYCGHLLADGSIINSIRQDKIPNTNHPEWFGVTESTNAKTQYLCETGNFVSEILVEVNPYVRGISADCSTVQMGLVGQSANALRSSNIPPLPTSNAPNKNTPNGNNNNANDSDQNNVLINVDEFCSRCVFDDFLSDDTIDFTDIYKRIILDNSRYDTTELKYPMTNKELANATLINREPELNGIYQRLQNISNASRAVNKLQTAHATQKYIGLGCSEGYALTGARINMTDAQVRIQDIEWICSGFNPNNPNNNENYEQAKNLGELIEQIGQEANGLAYQLNLGELLRDEVQQVVSLNSLPISSVHVLEKTYGTIFDVDGVESNYLDKLALLFEIELGSTSYRSIIAIIEDDTGRKHLALFTAFNDLTWGDLVPQMNEFAEGEHQFTNSLVTWILSNNGGVSQPITISNGEAQLGQFLHSELSFLYQTEDYNLELLQGVNIATALELDKLPNALENSFGFDWDQHTVILEGKVDIDLTDFLQGDWSSPNSVYFEATLPFTNFNASKHPFPADFSALELESVSLGIGVTDGQISMSLGSIVDAKLGGTDHRFKFMGGTIYSDEVSDFTFSARMLNTWDKPFGYSNVTLEQANIFFRTDSSFTQKQAMFTGELSVGSAYYLAGVNLESNGQRSSGELQLSVEHLDRQKLIQLLSHFGATGTWQHLPNDFELTRATLTFDGDTNNNFMARVAGTLTINNDLAVDASFKFTHSSSQGNKVEVSLGVTDLSSAEVASVLSYLSGRDWQNTIPRELFNIEALTVKMTLGNNSSLVANAHTEFCLFKQETTDCENSFVTSVQFSMVNNQTQVSLTGNLQGEVRVPLIDVPLVNPSIRLIAENGYQDIDIRSTIIFNGASVPVELEFESREGDIQEKFIIGPIDSFQINDLEALFKESSFDNPLNEYEKHNISVKFTDTTLELEKENDLYRLTAYSSATIDHNTATDIELDAMISATKRGSQPFSVFVALHETEVKKDSLSDDLSFADFAPALSNHSSDPGQAHGITLSSIKFEKSALVFSNSNINLNQLSYQAQNFLKTHFDGRAFPIPNGIHFMADLVLEQPSLDTFNEQTARFGIDNQQGLFVEVGIDFTTDNTPEFSLKGILPEVRNCDFFSDNCINGLPKWLVQTELTLFIDVKESELDIGLQGGLGFSIHDDIMELVLKGEFDATPTRMALDFCAELGVFDNDNPSFPSCTLPIGDSCGKSTNGQWHTLFGQDWLEFQDILFGLSFSPTNITFDAAAGVKVDGKDMLLREFELSINPETGIPTGFVIDVLSQSSLSTADFVSLSERFAQGSGMPHFLANSSKLPALYLQPEHDESCGQDLLALKVDLRAGNFPSIKAEGKLAFSIDGNEQNASRLGELQFEMDSHHLHFYGDLELGGKKLSETRLDLDSSGLNFASQLELPFTGQFVQVAKGRAECDFTVAKHGAACFNNIVSQEATNVYNCGVEELSGLAKCATHPSNLYWTGWGPFKKPHCRNIKSCDTDIDVAVCRDNFEEAVKQCDEYLTVDESQGLTLLAKVDAVIAVNGLQSEVKGSAEGDVCIGATCYYARGDIDVGLDPRHFKVNFGKVGVVKEQNHSFTSPTEDKMKESYPFVNENITYRGNLIDFDASGEGDSVVIRDTDQSSSTRFNNLEVLYSSRNEPLPIISGETDIEFIDNDADVLRADRIQFADFFGDGQTDVLVEYQDTSGNYRWLLAQNGSQSWEDVTPDSLISIGLQGEFARIQIDEESLSPTLVVKGILAGDFDGDTMAEILIVATTTSGVNHWYQCNIGISGECRLVNSSNISYEYHQLQIGYFNNDTKLDLFYNESGNDNNGRWVALLSSDKGEMVRKVLKSKTFSDLKEDAKADSILNSTPGLYDRALSRGLHLGDFDGDGLTDVLTARTRDSNGQWVWNIAYASSDYNKAQVYRDWNNPDRLFVSDIDGNGLADAVIAQDNDGNADYIWRVFYGGDANDKKGGKNRRNNSEDGDYQNDSLDTLITSINISTDLVHSGAIQKPSAAERKQKENIQ
ncbi:VCBS repeat-containing protein [Pleionea sediminis]|uniref:VCBS repeat-containing protein n=1 Tax=Pleionea sediminis TaxID=2569479 RepID=UPI001185A7E2|nr:VCBS repeat-containing protein [Pleionea sediminis]